MLWDDTPANEAMRGDVFGFVHNKKRIEFHTILQTFEPEMRMESWSKSVGMRGRKVIYLNAPCFHVMKWQKWVKFVGNSRV